MHPQVRDLYKRFLWVGRNYPRGLDYVRDAVKEKMFENSNLEINSISFKKAIGLGRYWVRELTAISKLHKYRTIAKRYNP